MSDPRRGEEITYTSRTNRSWAQGPNPCSRARGSRSNCCKKPISGPLTHGWSACPAVQPAQPSPFDVPQASLHRMLAASAIVSPYASECARSAIQLQGWPEFASIYFSDPLPYRDGAEVAAAGPALRHASTLSPGQVTSRGAAVISPDERAGRSRAQNPRNRDRAS